MTQNPQRIIPIYASNGEAEAFLVFPYLFNRSGEWIGFVTPKREVYSVMGVFVGTLTNDPRITRKRSEVESGPHLKPPRKPGKFTRPPSVPLAPMMSDLPLSLIDVLQDQPERLHTVDSGELREDMD
jgi:4-fold beta flower protein